MQEQDVRELLEKTAAVPAPPSAVDLDRAVRDGRRTRATRRAVLAGTTMFGVSAVLGAAAVLRPTRPASTDPAATTAPAWPPSPNGPLGGPTLPRVPAQFDRLGQWAVFGWLPFRPAKVSAEVGADYVGLAAETGRQSIDVYLFRGSDVPDEPLRMGGSASTAPAVAGQPARWVNRDDSWDEFSETLQWQFAPGNWAQVRTTQQLAGHPMPTGADRREMLHRVASTVGLSATRRQRFPFQTTALPADLPLFRVTLTLDADGRWDANIYSGVRSTIQHSALSITVTNLETELRRDDPLPPADIPSSSISRAEVDGHRAFHMRTDDVDELTVWLPDNVAIIVAAKGDSLRRLGEGGSLGLYRTIEVLADPASWSERPI
jgi:hypothetical protein